MIWGGHQKSLDNAENWLIEGCIIEVVLCIFTDSITPTVELNALAMRRGEAAMYRPIDMPRPQNYPPPNMPYSTFNQR